MRDCVLFVCVNVQGIICVKTLVVGTACYLTPGTNNAGGNGDELF